MKHFNAAFRTFYSTSMIGGYILFLIVGCSQAPPPETFDQARENAIRAAEGLYRCHRYMDAWLAVADPSTGLIPRNLRGDGDYWNGRDAGADNYPYLVLTAFFTDKQALDGPILGMLRTEMRLTARIDRLPDDYSFLNKGWRRKTPDLDASIFDGAEYAKDGLLMITEWMGPSPWSDRMIGIVDDIWKNARVKTPFGMIPSLNLEVNGDLLQVCSRLFWFTGDRKYLEWAARLGDTYLLENEMALSRADKMRLADHGCEVINGLSELYAAVTAVWPEKRAAYRKPLKLLYDRILALALNYDGFLYETIWLKKGTRVNLLTDTWGYNYDAFYTMYMLDGIGAYRDATRRVLRNLDWRYTGSPWRDKTMDGYADSIEGALNMYNREPVAQAARWIDTQIRRMWATQSPNGLIERWHCDGNFARTTLLYVLWKTQGIRIDPWRADVRLGAVRRGNDVLISLTSDAPWTGKLLFDRARHREIMHLPMDYPRINQFPEWFTVEQGMKYLITGAVPGTGRTVFGDELIRGIIAEAGPGREVRLRVSGPGPE